jgi:hypothetical protein
MKGLWAAFIVVVGVSSAYAGGLGGDLLNNAFPGAGTALDNANRQLKESVSAYKQLEEEASGAGRQVGNGAQTLGNNIIETTVNAGNDIIATAVKAGDDIVTTAVKAGNDTVIAIQRAGGDVTATYVKGLRDAAAQAQRSFQDSVEAGEAVVRFIQNQVEGQVGVINNAAKRVREGKIVDAVWGAAVEPVQSSKKNFAKATQESAIIYAAAQTAATAYGGPAGAAAYAAWYTTGLRVMRI